MLRQRKSLLERGDTIVEVLISIAVAGLVLAITYSTMNRNLLVTQASQERTEATKIAQGQLELIKAHNDTGDTTITSGTFCLDASSTTAIPGFTGGSPLPSLPDNFANYPAGCRGKGLNGFYNIGITTNSGIYKVFVRWDSVLGNGQQDQVIMVYEI
ncbi:MAG: hypothetical protein JWO47_857 [Candidatus Saccharibacteria bacterium]|nr:hypothetical protein [Candidatus Saccharibacteria bacterium]